MRGLNENYGRELMELHTLGVDGGYTQKDVTEVARCFTGWTIQQAPHRAATSSYNDSVHDKGEKIVLGVTIPAGGGMEDGEKVLDILARHPATAQFISKELAQRFVADNPPPALVDRMAKTFLDTDGDIREVMKTMLTSKEFLSQGAYRAKVKTPFEMVVSAVRATGAQVDYAFPLAKQIAKLGEPLYRKLEPTGYSNVNCGMGQLRLAAGAHEFRAGTGAEQDAGRESGHRRDSAADPDEDRAPDACSPMRRRKRSAAIDSAIRSARTRSAYAGAGGGLVLGSPDFQRRE